VQNALHLRCLRMLQAPGSCERLKGALVVGLVDQVSLHDSPSHAQEVAATTVSDLGYYGAARSGEQASACVTTLSIVFCIVESRVWHTA
jgi:hypothetical protein